MREYRENMTVPRGKLVERLSTPSPVGCSNDTEERCVVDDVTSFAINVAIHAAVVGVESVSQINNMPLVLEKIAKFKH